MRTMQQQLHKWMKVNKMHRPARNQKEPKPKRARKDFSERELRGLMGMDRPVYRRGKGGAFRQR